MTTSNIYDTIFKRKSIRKYDLISLGDKTLFEIEDYIKSVIPLYEEIKTEIRIVPHGGVRGLLSVKAPHYLVITSENKEGYLTNAGYMLQQIDLFLSSNGIGSCYLGMAQPTSDIKKDSKLECVMILAFGNAAESIHRSDISEFKRKPLLQITNSIKNDQFIEPARLSPSATNSQPWYFINEDDIIHAYCVKSNIIKAVAYGKLNKVDMGIALCHIMVTAKHFGKQINFIYEKDAQDKHPKGYYYIVSAILK